MGQKKIDSRIPALIRNGVQTGERSFIVMVGDKSRNQLPNLHYLLTSADLNGNKSVLWSYKKKLLGFTSHRKKRENKIKRDIKKGIREVNQQDPFELFISLQQIRYVYYKETEKILGNTYGMLILQDFEAMTPNILARTIETVAGGGLVVLLLQSMKSLKQLYSMTMDVHSRYRTEARDDVVARFNERFILSLASNRNCLVVDDELNVLPISGAKSVKALPPSDQPKWNHKGNEELEKMVDSLEGVKVVYPLVKLCKTEDQAKAILTFVDAVSDKTLRQTVALTAARGRGKSAAMGLAIAAAVAHGYSNIFITSPSPENLKTLFEFVFKGFDALGIEEHQDYDIIQSTNPEFNKAIVRVNVFKTHRQTLQWIQPTDHQVLGQAELVVIDEAAAIPLPIVKKLLGPYLVFMASTINGYEGTGRSLSLKLLSQLRASNNGDRKLREITLEEPIRYASGDPVEKWLNKLLCLDATNSAPGQSGSAGVAGYPHPSECELFSINRNTLFSFHPVSEAFLHKIMSLYVASHYKNSPNDLQLLSDAPAHQLYVLLAPQKPGATTLPTPLCVIQLAMEGQISKGSMASSLAAGQRGGGDLIPWVVSQQFQDTEFASLSGGRVVRIATNPDYVGMGYGARAMDQLARFFKGEFTPLREGVELFKPDFEIAPRITDKDLEGGLHEELTTRDLRKMPPLLMRLSEMQPDLLDYLGVSYGLTMPLYKFWKRQDFLPVYLRQTTNDLTGEHTAIMIKSLKDEDNEWLTEFSQDFGRRFIQLLSYQFREFSAVQALTILQTIPKRKDIPETGVVTKSWLDDHFSPFDLKRLDSYAVGRIDHHVITDLIPIIAEAYFTNELGNEVQLSSVQQATLLGMGLQKKDVGDVSVELNLPTNQGLAMFSKTMRKVSSYFRRVLSDEINSEMPEIKDGLDDDDIVAHEDARDGVKTAEVNDHSNDEESSHSSGDENDSNSAEEAEPNEDTLKKRELINSLDLDKYAISENAEFDADTAAKGAKLGKVAVKTPSRKRKESMETIYNEEMSLLKKAKRGKTKK